MFKLPEVFCFCLLPYLGCAFQTINFEHLNTSNGLSNNFVYCAYEDRDGYIWFGTEDGLNRWDRNNFKIFRNDPRDSSSISNNRVLWISEDKEGALWISTVFGLNCCDKYRESFQQYFFRDSISFIPHANTVGPIILDKNNIVWIGTRAGLIKYNQKSAKFSRYIPAPESLEFSLFSANYFIWIHKTDAHNILIGSADGVLKFNIPAKQFQRITPPQINSGNSGTRPVADRFKS